MWKDIEGYEDFYEINEYGEIRNKKTKQIRKLKPHKNGYIYIDLYKPKTKVKWFRVHRLVAKAFIPNPKQLPCVMHIDNNKSNNHIDNLKWGTISENTAQAWEDNLIDKRQDYIVYNDTHELLCHGQKEVMKLVNFLSSSSVNYAIKNHSKIRTGEYKGYKIRKAN